MKKNTIVISAFHCCGKSYCYKKYQANYSMLDSDSSQFSWEKDEDGKNTKIRSKDFPTNYIKHICENIGKVDFIFVSSHKEVREALEEAKVKHISVYPSLICREEYIQRAKNRGSSNEFVAMLYNNWDNFCLDLHEEKNGYVIKQELGENEYLEKEMLNVFYNHSRFFCCNKIEK